MIREISNSDGRAQSDVRPRLWLKYSKSCNGSYASSSDPSPAAG